MPEVVWGGLLAKVEKTAKLKKNLNFGGLGGSKLEKNDFCLEFGQQITCTPLNNNLGITTSEINFNKTCVFKISNSRNLEIRVLHGKSLRAHPFSALYDPWRGSKLQKHIFLVT